MNAITECLTEEELIALLSGESVSSEKSTHMEQCQYCQETRNQIRSDLDAIRAVANSSIDEITFSNPDVRKPRQPSQGTPTERGHQDGRLAIGSKVGNYTVIRLLGRGGQSEAYLVRQTDKGEDSPRFVLKISRITDAWGVPLSASQWHHLHAALKSEEETLYKLRGITGTLQYVTAGQVDLGGGKPEPYLVTDYVRGQTLQQRGTEFTDPQRAVLLVKKIAEILSHVNRIGVIHGDLKPQNVMLSDDDSPTVIDFGMARIRDVWNQGDVSEMQGGTIQYMSPEQAKGDVPRIGSATDVFALGAVLQQLVTQQKVYDGDHWKTCLEAAKAGRVNVADARAFGHRQLQHVVARCLASEPELRFANGGAVAEALSRLQFAKFSRWQFAGVFFLALLAITAILWLAFYPPWIEHSNSEPSSLATESPVPGLLGSDDLKVGEWNKKLPVTAGSRLRVEAQGPANNAWYLVWIDSRREVFVFSQDSPENPILTEPVDDGTKVRVVWPRLEEGTISIESEGGTELLMLVGFPIHHPISEQELKDAMAAVLTTADAWPDLPETVLARFDKTRVHPVSPTGTMRGPGKVEPSAYRQIEKTIRRIRETIEDRAEFIRGEAFHVSPNTE